MGAFLQGMRTLKPNGFSMWLSSEFILLGRPSSLATEREIMSIIFNYHRQRSDSLAACTFSSDQLLDVIKSNKDLPPMMNIRPAVLDVICSEFFSRPEDVSNLRPDSDEFSKAVDSSISALIKKVRTESLNDVARLLNDMHPWELAIIHKLAIGKPVGFSFVSTQDGDQSLDQFVSLLSGFPLEFDMDVKSPNRKILPPYSTYFAHLINSDGEITVDLEALR